MGRWRYLCTMQCRLVRGIGASHPASSLHGPLGSNASKLTYTSEWGCTSSDVSSAENAPQSGHARPSASGTIAGFPSPRLRLVLPGGGPRSTGNRRVSPSAREAARGTSGTGRCDARHGYCRSAAPPPAKPGGQCQSTRVGWLRPRPPVRPLRSSAPPHVDSFPAWSL